MPDADAPLLDALELIRARGPIGERSLDDAVGHADRFVPLLPPGATSVVDLGSGGGLPGLVIAWRRRDLRVVLAERRGGRADLLRRAVGRLALPCVEVWSGDVADLAATGVQFDAVVARSFGAPVLVARWGGALCRPGGVVLVSEPPVVDPARWPDGLLASHGLLDEDVDQGIRVLRRVPRGT